MYLRLLIFGISFVFYFFWHISNISAASVTMQNAPLQIGINDEYTVDTTLSINATDGTNYYLRGVFYQPGTTNYCGYTWNNNSWFNGPYSVNNGWTNFLPIAITNSSWSGQLKAKIDPLDPGCNISGNYAFRIERFTKSGSGNFDAQSELAVAVDIPTPTPTPVPTDPPTPTTMPTYLPTNKPTSSQTNYYHTSPTFLPKMDKTASIDAVLGTKSAENIKLLTPTPTETFPIIKTAKQDKNWISIIFAVIGVCLAFACGILIFLKTEKGKKLWNKFF